jgi:hypothetical protein
MKTVIESFFNSLKTGEPCSFKGLTAFPVFSPSRKQWTS